MSARENEAIVKEMAKKESICERRRHRKYMVWRELKTWLRVKNETEIFRLIYK